MRDLTPKEHELEPIEIASIDEIKAHKKKYDEIGIHPSDLKYLEDIKLFPFTTKEDLRRNYPFNMFAHKLKDIARIHASSGTTGKPTVVAYTKNDLEMWEHLIERCLRASGMKKGDMLHNAYGYGLFTGGLGLHGGAEKMGLTVIPVSGGMTARQGQLINDFKPKGITVTPSYILSILDEFKAQGLDPKKSSLEVGIFGAEPWTNSMRSEIESQFDMHAVDIYGLSEVLGPGVANECVESKDGLHVWEDYFYPEIIDVETGNVLEDGEKGELVFSSLCKEAFPIIRYRTKDLTRLMKGTARSMRRMEKITGRSDDMMIIRGVNIFPTQIEEQLLKIDSLSPHFQIKLIKDGRMDKMIVYTEHYKSEDVEQSYVENLSANLKKRVKDIMGLSIEVDVGKKGSVPRSEGKAVRVIDER